MTPIDFQRERRPVRPPRYRRPWGKWAAYAGLIVAALLIGGTGGAVMVARMSLPNYDGEIILSGLAAAVTVTRDEFGVPRIEAGNMTDAYRALGYIHAADRMFQMEMSRRTGAGRLAELLGEPGLGFDKLMRTLGLYTRAEESVAAMARTPRSALQAYAGGVNAWLENHDGPLPPEFLLLRHTPEPWVPADSAVWGLLMALQLSDNWRGEIDRARAALRLTPDQMIDLWPPVDPDSATTLAENFDTYCCADRQIFARLADDLPGSGTQMSPFAFASASNEWVVSGDHSESGLPLLANDPHLGFSAPLLWYLVEIVTPSLSLTGVSVPGMPFLMLGHNGHIAWGLTTTHADVQDLFIERVDPADPLRYLTANGASQFDVRREEIFVRGREKPETITVRETYHGPVISDISPGAATLTGEGEMIALAFNALAPDNRTPEALYDLNRAENWAEFTAALEKFAAPLQNFAYADTDGHIGFYVPGRLPIRKSGDGRLPVPGWTGEFDWTGFVPFDEMPHKLDPPGGRIVNANNRVAGRSYPHLIAADWPDPGRAARIGRMLDDISPADSTTFKSIQLDIKSSAVEMLLPTLLDHMTLAGAGSVQAQNALDLLKDWDGRMDRDRPEPLIFTAWAAELGPTLYNDELGDAADVAFGIRPRTVLHMLDGKPEWCDDVTTPTLESCPGRVGVALRTALATLSEIAGDDPADWRWGDLHKARFSHQIFGRVPILRDLIDIEIETDGDNFTVNRGTHILGQGDDMFTQIHGPGYRAIYDLADLSTSQMIIATGQSGHPLSRHFGDLTRMWRDGDYLTPGTRRNGEDGFPASRMVFLPSPR